MAAALAPIQARELTVLPYLDDWLIVSPKAEQAVRDTAVLLGHDSRLTVNENLPFSEKGGEHFATHRLLPQRQSVEIWPLSQTAVYADCSIHGDPTRSPFLTAPLNLGQHT